MDPSGTRGSGPGCPHTSPITPVRGSPHSHPVSTAPEMPLAEGLVVQSQGFEAKGPPQDLLHDLGQGATPLSPCSACPRGQFPASVSRSLCVWLSPSPLRGTPGQQPRAVTAPEGTPAPAYGCHPQAASWARAWAALYQAAGGAVSWTSSTQSSASVHLGAAGPSLGTLPGGPGRPGGQWQTAASGPQTHRCREAGVPSTQEWGLGCTATPPPRGCPRAVTTQGHLDEHPWKSSGTGCNSAMLSSCHTTDKWLSASQGTQSLPFRTSKTTTGGRGRGMCAPGALPTRSDSKSVHVIKDTRG